MTYDQLLIWDDYPIAYANLTARMARAQGLGWFQPQDVVDWDPISTYPLSAPWYDADFPDLSLGYCGLVVTSMTPIDNSYTTHEVTPLARGGAALGPRYEGHREIVVAGTIIAANRPSAVYGLEWIGNLLQFGRRCGEGERSRRGYTIEVWMWAPPQGHRQGPHQRFLYDVHATSGPTVLRERELDGDCGSIIDIEFTLTAANPNVFSNLTDFGAFQSGTVKEAYWDLLHLGPDGNPLPTPRRYNALPSLVRPNNATTYAELLAALVTYSSGAATDSEANPVV